MNEFGVLIESILEKKNMTKEEFAKSIGYEYSYISHLSHGHRNISYNIVKDICKILDLDYVQSTALKKTLEGNMSKKKLYIEGKELNDYDFYLATLFVNEFLKLPEKSKVEIETIILENSSQ